MILENLNHKILDMTALILKALQLILLLHMEIILHLMITFLLEPINPIQS